MTSWLRKKRARLHSVMSWPGMWSEAENGLFLNWRHTDSAPTPGAVGSLILYVSRALVHVPDYPLFVGRDVAWDKEIYGHVGRKMTWLVGQGSERERLKFRAHWSGKEAWGWGQFQGREMGPFFNCKLMLVRAFNIEVMLNNQAGRMTWPADINQPLWLIVKEKEHAIDL